MKFFKSSSYKNNDYFDVPALLFEVSSEEKMAYKIDELTESNVNKLKSVKEKLVNQELPEIKSKNEAHGDRSSYKRFDR